MHTQLLAPSGSTQKLISHTNTLRTMGQCISVHIRSDRARKYQLQSLLIQQPTDILDLIFEVLEPDSTALLSLTCNGLYLRYFEQALTNLGSASQEQNHTFQLLWERDVGHRQ